jgi:hypothetical protein
MPALVIPGGRAQTFDALNVTVIPALLMEQSGSNEVLVSRVVTDLAAGAGLKFAMKFGRIDAVTRPIH